MDALNGRFGSTGSASAGDHAGLMTTGIRTSVVRAWETCLPERGPAEAVHSPWAFSSQRGTNCSMLIIDSRSTGRPERLSEDRAAPRREQLMNRGLIGAIIGVLVIIILVIVIMRMV